MRVVHCKREPYTVYIGRPSVFGNPFVLVDEVYRTRVLQRYELWARSNCDLLDAIEALPLKSVLGCWCSPKPCHGDIIVKLWRLLHGRDSQFEKDRMFFGQRGEGRPQANGFWLEPEHCEFCAPKDQRWPHSRCEVHACFLSTLTLLFNEQVRGKGRASVPNILELGPEEWEQFRAEMQEVEDRTRLVPASGSASRFKGVTVRRSEEPGIRWLRTLPEA